MPSSHLILSQIPWALLSCMDFILGSLLFWDFWFSLKITFQSTFTTKLVAAHQKTLTFRSDQIKGKDINHDVFSCLFNCFVWYMFCGGFLCIESLHQLVRFRCILLKRNLRLPADYMWWNMVDILFKVFVSIAQ